MGDVRIKFPNSRRGRKVNGYSNVGRTHEKEAKRNEAEIRNAKWDTLSPWQKLVALDNRLGDGVGAVKQREKLYESISKGD